MKQSKATAVKPRVLRGLPALALVLALLLAACGPQQPVQLATQVVAGTEPVVNVAGTEVAPVSTAQALLTQSPQLNQVLVQLNALIGRSLRQLDGQVVGQITDVLVNPQGDIEFIVVEVPATATRPARQVAINWDEVQAAVRAAQGGQLEEVELFFRGTTDDLNTAAELDLEGALAESIIIRVEGTDLHPALDNLIRVRRLPDLALRTPQNVDLGRLQELLVDLRQGRVDFGLIDLSQLMGPGAAAAIPFESFNIDPNALEQAEALVLNVDEETLRNAPRIDLDQLPPILDPEQSTWDETVIQFWNSLG